MLKNPCVFMEEEYGMQTGGQRRVDVAFGTVANHPAGVRMQLMTPDNSQVGSRILFANDLDGGEVSCEAGTSNFVRLLGMISLGHEDQPVPLRKVPQCLFDIGKQ